MNISLRTRGFSIESYDTSKEYPWNELGDISGKSPSVLRNQVDWKREIAKLTKIVLGDMSLTIDNVIEPGINIYDKNNEIELYIGSYGLNTFDICLYAIYNKELEFEQTEVCPEVLDSVINDFINQRFEQIRTNLKKEAIQVPNVKSILLKRAARRVNIKRALILFIVLLWLALILYSSN